MGAAPVVAGTQSPPTLALHRHEEQQQWAHMQKQKNICGLPGEREGLNNCLWTGCLVCVRRAAVLGTGCLGLQVCVGLCWGLWDCCVTAVMIGCCGRGHDCAGVRGHVADPQTHTQQWAINQESALQCKRSQEKPMVFSYLDAHEVLFAYCQRWG